MTSPLHEKDLNTLTAGSVPADRRIFKTPGLQGAKTYRAVDLVLSKTRSSSEHTKASSSGLFAGAAREVNKSSSSSAPPPAGPNTAHLLSVEDMLQHLQQHKLTDGQAIKTRAQLSALSENVCLIGENSGRIKWIQPSGPRRSGEGTEDEEQGIIAAESTATGGAMVRITLLAAGFVIGPSGSSVREITKQTGADIKSWTEKPESKSTRARPTRTFVVEGKKRAVVLALDIMCDAVDRYKELCEGNYCGQFVERVQKVRGVEFSYQPPPRNVVPYAAALKGQHPRLGKCEPAPELLPGHLVSAAANRSSIMPGSMHDSLSTEEADSCSQMDDSAVNTVTTAAAQKTPLHSKAEVMQTYLNAQAPAQPRKLLTRLPNDSSSCMYTSSSSPDAASPYSHDATPDAEAPKPSSAEALGSFSNLSSVQSPYGSGASAGRNPFGMTIKQKPSAAPRDLVQVKPNVWLPLAAVQQAGGDVDLALHMLAQESLPTSQNQPLSEAADTWASSAQAKFAPDSIFTPDSASHVNCKDPGDFDMSCFEPDAQYPSFMQPGDHSIKRDNVGALWGESPGAMKQSTIGSVGSKGGWGRLGFDPVIQPPSHPVGAKPNAAAATGQTAAARQLSSGFSFASPTASAPFMGSSASNYISPQCVMDSSSLFSYNLATPEQMAQARPGPWYATPEPAPPAFGGWGTPFGPQGPAAAAFRPCMDFSAPPTTHTDAASVMGSGGQSGTSHSPLAWSEPAVRQLAPEFNAGLIGESAQGSIAASMGAHNPLYTGPGGSTVPWIQGSHPLLGNGFW